MEMAFKELMGLLTAVLVLAGLSVVVVNGGKVAGLLNAGGTSFSRIVRAATLR